MKKLSAVLMILLMVFAMAAPAFADASPWTMKNTNSEKMLGKLDFGVKNLLFGWTELISRPLHGVQDNGIQGGFEGLGNGLYYGIAETLGGALHVVTFPITNLDVPLPNGGFQGFENKK